MNNNVNIKVFKPNPSFFGIRVFESLAFWLLLQGTYDLSTELTKKLSEGQLKFGFSSPGKNLVVYQEKQRVK